MAGKWRSSDLVTRGDHWIWEVAAAGDERGKPCEECESQLGVTTEAEWDFFLRFEWG